MTIGPQAAGQAVHVESVEELVKVADVAHVVFQEVSARRLRPVDDAEADGDGDGDKTDDQVAVRSSDRDLEVRCRVSGEFNGGRYVADVSVCYELDFGAPGLTEGGVVISTEAMNAFVSKVGVMAAYPFLREALHQSAARLAVSLAPISPHRRGRHQTDRLASSR